MTRWGTVFCYDTSGEVPVRREISSAGHEKERAPLKYRCPSIPRATPQFARRYKRRTAVERVNDRWKVLWGLDDGTVVGSRRFSGHVIAVLIVPHGAGQAATQGVVFRHAAAVPIARNWRNSPPPSEPHRSPDNLPAQAARVRMARQLMLVND